MKYESHILCVPVFVSIGIFISFSKFIDLSNIIISAALLAIFYFYFNKNIFIFLCLFIFFAPIGSIVTNARINSLQHDTIDSPVYMPELEGVVQRTKQFFRGSQITIGEIPQFSGQKNIKNIKLSTYKHLDVYTGDRIKVFSVQLQPIPQAVAIDGYNFGKEAYFQQISATGRIMGKIVILSRSTSFTSVIDRLRARIVQYMQNNLAGQGAAVLAAIAIGDKHLLTDSSITHIRNAGLAHMMAVSGFHMSTIVGLIFHFSNFIQILLLKIFKKEHLSIYHFSVSAVLCAIAGFIYLLIVEIPVSAKRAYIMLLLFLVAIVAKRLTSSKYNIAMAATIILLTSPEMVLSPSLQMSFMATLAIISLYQYKRHDFMTHRNTQYNLGGSIISSAKMTAMSSLAATLATLPFSAYYFNSCALLGIISNIIVAPMLTLIITPAFILGVIFSSIPFLNKILMIIVNHAINLILKIAEFISSQAYATIDIRQIPFSSMLVFSLGVIFLCSTEYKKLSIPVLFIGIAIVVANPPSDIFIGVNNDKLVLAFYDGEELKTNSRKNFLIQEWANQWGHAKISNIKCIDHIFNMPVTIDKLYVKIGPDILVSRHDLSVLGTHQIWLNANKTTVKHSVNTWVKKGSANNSISNIGR